MVRTVKRRIFICDACAQETILEEEIDENTLPYGWARGSTGSSHFCPDCARKLASGNLGTNYINLLKAAAKTISHFCDENALCDSCKLYEKIEKVSGSGSCLLRCKPICTNPFGSSYWEKAACLFNADTIAEVDCITSIRLIHKYCTSRDGCANCPFQRMTDECKLERYSPSEWGSDLFIEAPNPDEYTGEDEFDD